MEKDTNKSNTTQTTASSNQGKLALILSHSVVLTTILQQFIKQIQTYRDIELCSRKQ